MAISTYTPLPDRIIHDTEVDFKARTQLGTTVHLMQYDKSLPIVAVALYSNGQPYQIPTGAEMNVRVGKSDGTKVYNPVLGCNANRTICYFEVTQQMTSAYGPTLAILEVIVDSAIAGSSYIPLDIAKNPAQDEAILSSNEYKAMNELIDEAREALGKPPKIQNGTWWLWDSEEKTYIDTGSSASGIPGPAGTGIDDIVLNSDYTLTIRYGDTAYTTGSIRGATGAPGETGTTFTPAVSQDGVLSWSNDGGKQNPESVNLKGPTVPKTSNLLKGDGAGGMAIATPDTDYLTTAPVTSVNGQTGEVKGTFYVTVTQGDDDSITADKTAAEVYAAYAAGYAVYAVTKFPAVNVPFELPLVSAMSMGDKVLLGFAALGSTNLNSAPMYPTVACDGNWYAWLGTLARASDIPTIPTELKNPNALSIKIGDTTTSYDGSTPETVEIPKGVPSVTTADNGKFLRVVNGAWASAAIDNANGGSF